MKRAVRLDGLQSLRLFAALLVVFDHSLLQVMAAGGIDQNSEFAFRTGGFGVFIFFVISGFVMAHSMSESFGRTGVAPHFLRRRIVRIVPLYWIVTLGLTLRSQFTDNPVALKDLVFSLLFIPYSQSSGLVQPVNGVGWTLNYEIQFYLIFACCLVMPWKQGAFLVTAILCGLVAFSSPIVEAVNGTPLQTAVTFWTDPVLLYFLAGIWLGFAKHRLEHIAARFGMGLTGSTALTAITIIAFEILLFAKLMPQPLEVAFVLATVLLACSARGSATSTVERALIEGGDASYSIYLTHAFAIGAVSKVIHPSDVALPQVTWIACALISSVAVGLFVYRAVERPALRYLQLKLDREPNR